MVLISRGVSNRVAGSYLTARTTSRRSCVCALIALAMVWRGGIATAQPRVFDQYTLTSWTDEEGLFGGWIVGLAQDAQGYLWIGTVSGLIRFDGLHFERFHGTEQHRLPRRSVSAVHGTRDGSVWVGFSGGGGIYRIHGQGITEYGTSEGLSEARTTAFVEDVDGSMLAATPGGLYRLENEHWARWGSAEGLPSGPVFAVYFDGAGGLWATTSDGVFRRDRAHDTFHVVTRPAEAPLSLSQSADGAIWSTHPSLGYLQLANRVNQAVESRDRHSGNGYRLLHDRAGNFWVATLGQGLWFVPAGSGQPQVIGMHNGLSNDTVRVVFEDRNGDVWAGTTVGLHRFARRRVTPITDLGVVRAVEAGDDGDVWVGTADGLVRFSNGVRRWYRTRDGLPSNDVRALHIDAAGSLWVSTATGVARRRHERFSTLSFESGRWPLSGDSTIATDAAGNIWISSEDQGLFRWRDGRLIAQGPSVRGQPASVHSVSSDRQGRLWLRLGGGGLGLIDRGGAFSLLREGDRYNRSDLAAHEDDQGTLWFGSGERLTRFKDGQLSAVSGGHGLPADAIRALVTDRDGNLWLGTSGGIVRMTRSEFDRAVADPAHAIDFRSYNSSDGLPGAPVRLGYPNAVRSADGKLWFVTGNGVTVIDPQRLSATRPALPVYIERITANGRAFQPSGVFTLPPRTTGLQIDYAALEFFSPRQVQFRYRLEGLDEQWTDAGSRRQALFTNLSPGRYVFRVIGRSSEGIWSERGDALAFSIAPTFYQTGAFMALCGIVAGGLALLAVRARRQRFRRRFELVLAERVRMARELHDTLLQSLAGLELQMDTMSSQLDSGSSTVKQQLDRLRRQIQSDITEARQSIWALRSPMLEARDLAGALQDLGHALAGASRVRFEFSVSGTAFRCDDRVEEQLLRIGREALSNAVRHAQATVVKLELCYDAESVRLRVSDDGRGFDTTETSPSGGAAHWGLAIMRERTAAIGGRLTLVSGLGAGTSLEMIAPKLARS